MAYSRYIYINGRRYDTVIDTCTFSWDDKVGCVDGSLHIPSARFDNFMNIDIGDIVDIRYSAAVSTRWWLGTVAELSTSLTGGLTVSLIGMHSFLSEVRPTGRFGSDVTTDTPANESSAVDTGAGTLAAGAYDYRIASLDDDGETFATALVEETLTGSTNAVTLTWDTATGANGYRVYRKIDAGSWVYFDVSELTFVDDGTATGTASAAGPLIDGVDTETSTTPTIAATDVESVVNYLLNTFLPPELSKGTVNTGSAETLDDYDLTNSTATLKEVLFALAEIVGDVVTGVDEDGAVFFVAEATGVPGNNIFTVGEASGLGSVMNVVRRKSRDGVSFVKVEGEEDLEDPDQTDGEVTFLTASDEFADWETLNPNKKWYEDHRRFGLNINARNGIAIWGSIDALPVISPETIEFFKVGASMVTVASIENYFYLCPYLWWMYNQISNGKLSNPWIARVLGVINSRIQQVKDSRSDTNPDYDGAVTSIRSISFERGKIVTKEVPGVVTSTLAGQAAANMMLEFTPNPSVWTISLVNVTALLEPGREKVKIRSIGGPWYTLPFRSVSYSFEDVAYATITAGDREYDEASENEDQKKAVQSLSNRRENAVIWRPYSA